MTVMKESIEDSFQKPKCSTEKDFDCENCKDCPNDFGDLSSEDTYIENPVQTYSDEEKVHIPEDRVSGV